MKPTYDYNSKKVIRTAVIHGIGTSIIIGLSEGRSVTATPVFYKKITTATITIAADGDRADLYFPRLSTQQRDRTELPVVLMLPGALVDKADYSSFATQVARFGFVVVVPNNQRTLIGPGGQTFSGLFAEQEQVNQVLAQMRIEDRSPTSPIFKLVDPTKLGLMPITTALPIKTILRANPVDRP